jgi:pilus assembly protein FimV
VDSSFLESRLQPDSFFGASGGQRIDTNEGGGTGSSLAYSPSQLDAAGDVDPVAEADVYLAYGRDLQAEEILKEALQTTPGRAAIHAKLCEIYAKRRDIKSFNAMAAKAHTLTKGIGADWGRISGMGLELDATHPLYKDSPKVADSKSTASVISQPASQDAAQTAPAGVAAAAAANVLHEIDFDLDLDLDFEIDSNSDSASALSKPTAPSLLSSASSLTTPSPLTITAPHQPQGYMVLPDLDLDFGSVPEEHDPGTANSSPVAQSLVNTSPLAAVAIPSSVPAAAAGGLHSGMLEFNLDSLSLDLGTPVGPDTAADDSGTVSGDSPSDNPLETKFLLAEEFRSLGDDEGARSLAEEVLADAQGPLKAKAQAFIKALA